MTVYTGPVFEMAARQFETIADYIEIPHDERSRLLYPKRAVTVACPIHRDDGSVAVFHGYRVQHHLTLGPTKGGTRFSANLDLGEVGALGDLDELEMRAGRVAVWRGEGRHHGRSGRAQHSRVGGTLPPLHAGDDPLRRPAYRRDGPRHGHQRAGHGLVHGHLLHVPGPYRDRDRHRQAGRLRRHRRTPRGDRARGGPSGDARGRPGRRGPVRRDRDRPGLRQRRLGRRPGTGDARGQGDRRERPHRLLFRRRAGWTSPP